MYYIILTKPDGRLSSYGEIVGGESNQFYFDDVSGYEVVLVESVDIDAAKDLGDYRYDRDLGRLVYDPLEPEAIAFTDLETGEAVTMTQEDFDALVDEKVRNNVEAVLSEMMADAGRNGLQIAGAL